jgi:hypothetical protein
MFKGVEKLTIACPLLLESCVVALAITRVNGEIRAVINITKSKFFFERLVENKV